MLVATKAQLDNKQLCQVIAAYHTNVPLCT